MADVITVLTYLGEAWAAGRLAGTATTDGHFIGWGSGEGEAAKDDTTLFIAESESHATATVSVVGSGVSAAYEVEATLTADSDKTITNAGTFTAITSGTMILHASFDPQDLNEDDQITFTFSIDPS